MASYHIDEIDQKILSFLVKNARMPFLEIARECGVSGAAIHQRFKRLEANGVITGSRLQVKPQALGLNVCAYVSISLSESTKYPDVIANLKKIHPEDSLHPVHRHHDFPGRAHRAPGVGERFQEYHVHGPGLTAPPFPVTSRIPAREWPGPGPSLPA